MPVSRALCLASVCWFSVACDSAGDTTIDITHSPCEPLVVAPDPDTTAEERESVSAAMLLWNQRAHSRLGWQAEPGVPEVALRFEEASLVFLGLYDDEVGRVLINRKLTDHHERTVTIAHELGHVFGLFHISRSERASVMNTANVTIEPTVEDADALATLWGPCPVN